MNHYHKQRKRAHRELVYRSATKYIRFSNQLNPKVQHDIDELRQHMYHSGCCSICYNSWEAEGKRKKERANRKWIKDQIRDATQQPGFSRLAIWRLSTIKVIEQEYSDYTITDIRLEHVEANEKNWLNDKFYALAVEANEKNW